MIHLIQILACLCLVTAELTKQIHVPAILFSHSLIPGTLEYQENYDQVTTVSLDKVDEVIKHFVDPCSSNTYVIVNQPGITKTDFVNYRRSFGNIAKYMAVASSLNSFEQIEPGLNLTSIGSYIVNKCKTRDVITVKGGDDTEIPKFIDSAKRVFIIEFPELPRDETRSDVLLENDRFFMKVLASFPSPYTTVIYTSDFAADVSVMDIMAPVKMFADIVNDPLREYEIERNNRIRPESEERWARKPDIKPPVTDYIRMTCFSKEFLDENKLVLVCCFTTALTALYLRSQQKVGQNPIKTKKNVTQDKLNKSKSQESVESKKTK